MFAYLVGICHESGPTAGGVCSVNAWCSRSVDVVQAVADQKCSDRSVPRYRYMTELVWSIVEATALDSTFKINHCGHPHLAHDNSRKYL